MYRAIVIGYLAALAALMVFAFWSRPAGGIRTFADELATIPGAFDEATYAPHR
jgi:hypothetical protein